MANDGRRRTGFLVYANTWFLYCGQACVFPHLTRYYDLDLHLADWQIGTMMALTSLSGVLMQPVWGFLADRVMGRTQTLRVALSVNILFLCAFTFAYQLGGFYLLMLMGMLFYVGYSASQPLNSSIILSYLGTARRHLFGRVRVAGSISFTVGMFLICPIMVGLSQSMGLYDRTLVFLTSCVLFGLAILSTVWNCNHFEHHSRPEFRSFYNLITNRNLLFFYLSIFITSVGASAGIQYIGPYIGHRGLSERFFASFWLIGVTAEILLTYNLHHVVRRLGMKWTVITGYVSEFIRWFCISNLSAPEWILLSNVLHGPAVLGVFFVSAMYLDCQCEKSVRSTAQALLYFSFMAGQVTGYMIASTLVTHYSYLPRAGAIQSSFFWFSLCALIAATFAATCVKKESQRRDESRG